MCRRVSLGCQRAATGAVASPPGSSHARLASTGIHLLLLCINGAECSSPFWNRSRSQSTSSRLKICSTSRCYERFRGSTQREGSPKRSSVFYHCYVTLFTFACNYLLVVLRSNRIFVGTCTLCLCATSKSMRRTRLWSLKLCVSLQS